MNDSGFQSQHPRKVGLMPSLTPADRTHRRTTIRITDLAVTDNKLEGLTFEECHIIGPAVLGIIRNVRFDRCSFEGTPEELIWEVPPERPSVLGVIGLSDCQFYGCRFTNIGLAMSPDGAASFRRELGSTSDG